MKPPLAKNNSAKNSRLVEGALGFLLNHQEVNKDKFFSSGGSEEALSTNDEKQCADRVNRARSHNFEPLRFRSTLNELILSKVQSTKQGTTKVHPLT